MHILFVQIESAIPLLPQRSTIWREREKEEGKRTLENRGKPVESKSPDLQQLLLLVE